MASVRLLSVNMLHLPVIAEKVSAGQASRKGIEYYLKWLDKHDIADLCDHLLKAAESYPSVLEHIVFSFYIDGCSRACSHQLVRHRLASYTQESQRYSVINCEEPRLRWVLRELGKRSQSDEVPDELVKAVSGCAVIPPYVVAGGSRRLYVYLASVASSIVAYFDLVNMGIPAEDARYVLPQSVRTRILMTVNLRELLHIAKLRTSRSAQWEIREVVSRMVRAVEEKLPCVYDLVARYRG